MRPTQKIVAAATAVGAVFGFTFSALAGDEGWVTDFEAAKAMAAKEKKDMLIDFTGSDWCGWCIRLKKEVFSQDAFKKDAPTKFVMVELDYPQDKKLPETLKAQNEKLREQFQIQGYPTIYLADEQGRGYAKTGYQKGGPEAYVKHLDELRKVRAARDEAMAKAEKAEGLEKAKGLKAALATMDPAIVEVFYTAVTDQIIKLDPEDTLGLKAEKDFAGKFSAFQKDLEASAQGGNLDGIPAKIDAFIAENKLTGEKKQTVMMGKMGVYFNQGKHSDALNLAKEVVAIAPDTEVGQQVSSIIPRIEQFIKEQTADAAEDAEDTEEKEEQKPKKAE